MQLLDYLKVRHFFKMPQHDPYSDFLKGKEADRRSVKRDTSPWGNLKSSLDYMFWGPDNIGIYLNSFIRGTSTR
jgi:hypothetical protein